MARKEKRDKTMRKANLLLFMSSNWKGFFFQEIASAVEISRRRLHFYLKEMETEGLIVSSRKMLSSYHNTKPVRFYLKRDLRSVSKVFHLVWEGTDTKDRKEKIRHLIGSPWYFQQLITVETVIALNDHQTKSKDWNWDRLQTLSSPGFYLTSWRSNRNPKSFIVEMLMRTIMECGLSAHAFRVLLIISPDSALRFFDIFDEDPVLWLERATPDGIKNATPIISETLKQMLEVFNPENAVLPFDLLKAILLVDRMDYLTLWKREEKRIEKRTK